MEVCLFLFRPVTTVANTDNFVTGKLMLYFITAPKTVYTTI